MIATPQLSGTPFCLLAKQAEFKRSAAFIRGFVGGRYAGKTVVGSFDMMTDTVPDQNYLIVGPDYPAIMDGPFPQFIKIAKYLGIYITHKLTPETRVICRAVQLDPATGAIRGAGGKCRFNFRTANNPESLRGGGRLKAWLDEASLMPQTVYDIILPSLRSEFGGPSQAGRLTMTFTPKGKRHWTYGTFFQEGPDGGEPTPQPDTFLVNAPSRDNFWVPGSLHDRITARFTTRMQEQELKGHFTEIEGLMFHREWFANNVISPSDVPKKTEGRIRYFDKAATADGGDWSCGVRISRDYDGVFYVEDMIRGQWSYGVRNRKFLEAAKSDHRAHSDSVNVMEQEPAAGGKESFERTLREFTEAGLPVFRDLPGVGGQFRKQDGQQTAGPAKVRRAQEFAANAEFGMIKLVRGDWNRDWLDEVCAFPETTTADIVDATSGAVNRLASRTGFKGTAPSMVPAGPVNHKRYGVQSKAVHKISNRKLAGRYPGLKD